VFGWIRGSKKAEAVDRATSLATRPVRNRLVKWETTEEGAVLHVPLKKMGRAKGFAAFRPAPESKDIVLDEIGGGLWARCDGEHTTADLLGWMRDRWQFSYREAEQGLTHYLRTLAKRGLVAFALPEGSGARRHGEA